MMVGPSFNDEQGVDVFVQNEAAVNTVKPIRTKGKTTKTPAGAIPNTRLQIRHKVGHGAATFVDVPRSDTSLSSSSRALADRGQQILAIQCLFQKASEYLHPSKAFRATVSIYAERKMFVLFLIHFVVTVIVSRTFYYSKGE